MDAERPSTLQDVFLTYVRDKGVDVTIFLANGVRLHGRITAFDPFTIQLVQGKVAQEIYKSAVLTISPTGSIDRFDPETEGQAG